MIKIAIIGGPILSGEKKNLIMEYFRHIDKSQVQIDIICNDNSNAIPTEEIESLGGRVFIVPSFEKLPAHTWALYKIFKREKYDVVHAYNSTMNLFPMFAAKIAGVKVRISESLSMAAKGEKTLACLQSLYHSNQYSAVPARIAGTVCGVRLFSVSAVGPPDHLRNDDLVSPAAQPPLLRL